MLTPHAVARYNVYNVDIISQWDNPLVRIRILSEDLRFAELKKTLESYDYADQPHPAAAVTILF